MLLVFELLSGKRFDCISVSRPINRSITLTEPTAQAESRIADKLSFAKIWNWRFYWMPKYFKYFESFSAPERPLIQYKEVIRDLSKLRSGNVLDALKDEYEDDINDEQVFFEE